MRWRVRLRRVGPSAQCPVAGAVVWLRFSGLARVLHGPSAHPDRSPRPGTGPMLDGTAGRHSMLGDPGRAAVPNGPGPSDGPASRSGPGDGPGSAHRSGSSCGPNPNGRPDSSSPGPGSDRDPDSCPGPALSHSDLLAVHHRPGCRPSDHSGPGSRPGPGADPRAPRRPRSVRRRTAALYLASSSQLVPPGAVGVARAATQLPPSKLDASHVRTPERSVQLKSGSRSL